jgi:AcrR family transcriptional regulator
MTVPATSAESRRQRDPERTRQEILDVALAEFARNGYSGARVDEIAARTRTTKRMIYYYFTNKEQLYIEVLERAYSTARDAERRLDVDHLEPVLAIRTLAELTLDHHESHPDFINLVAIENIHRAEVSGARPAQHSRRVDHCPHPRARLRGGRLPPPGAAH